MHTMTNPAPTQLPIATFQNKGNTSPAYLLEYLHQLSDQVQADPKLGRDDNTSWFQVVSGLTEEFLASFPTSQELPWNTMHEKLKLTEVSLKLIQQSTERVESLFTQPDKFAESVLARILHLCFALEAWIDMSVPAEDGYPSPQEMRDQAVRAGVAVLRSLGNNALKDDPTSPGADSMTEYRSLISRDILKDILLKCVTGCNDLLSLSLSAVYPVSLNLFATVLVQERYELNSAATMDTSANISVDIPSPSGIPYLLVPLFEICLQTLSPPLQAHWYLLSVVRRVVNLSQDLYDFLSSPSCLTTASGRARALTTSCHATLMASKTMSLFEGVADCLRSRLLQLRLQAGPTASWECSDDGLQQMFRVPYVTSPTVAEVQPVLTILRTERWGEAGNSLRTLAIMFLSICIPSLDDEGLRMVVDCLKLSEEGNTYAGMLQAVHSRLELLGNSAEIGHVSASDIASNASWRSKLKVAVQAIIEPVELAWMDEDVPPSDAQYISRALGEIESRFSCGRPLYNHTANARRALAQSFAKLPLIISQSGVSCPGTPSNPEISPLAVYIPVSTLLLDGPKEEASALVRKSVYDALAQVLRHHTYGSVGNILEYTTDVIGQGMKDEDRSVRLTAGQAFADLIRLYQACSNDAFKQAERLFAILYHMFDLKEDRFKETTLITVGKVGKIANTVVLGQAVCCLVSQLGSHNTMLNGTAFLQLQSLAKHHEKTPYHLLSPYMDSIAPFLVSRVCTHRDLVVAACHFISVPYEEFIRLTLNRTLPQIFALCDSNLLDEVATAAKETPQQFLLKYDYEILAHAFRLQGHKQCPRILSFILAVMRKTARETVTIGSVVRSCIVPLLAELVVSLGDNNPGTAELALQALEKVERCVTQSETGSKGTFQSNTGAFLKSYMLGIMTHLKDRLQDLGRKYSPELKRKVLRCLGPFASQIGPAVSGIAPQIMASLQAMLVVEELADVTLQSWYVFLTSLQTRDLGPHVGPTSSFFVAYWNTFSPEGRDTARRCLEFIVCHKGAGLGPYLDEVVDFRIIPDLAEVQERLASLRHAWKPRDKLQRILERATSESLTVAVQSLHELKSFMSVEHEDYIRALASGDVFDPLIGRTISTLFAAACRDGEEAEMLRITAFDCLGALGAVDPDRFDMGVSDTRTVMLSNFVDESESASFALHLIRDVLVGAYRSTSDINYQSHLAYAIQQLLCFCKFTPALITPGSTIPLKVRKRWRSLPKHVTETITPFLESRFQVGELCDEKMDHPIYSTKQTYREWIQSWASYLIARTSGEYAKTIFKVFVAVVRNKDVGVAHHLLPHLVLNVLISGEEHDTQLIRSELLTVLEDQVDGDSQSSADKRLLSAQTVFMLMDHLNQWVHIVRQDIRNKKVDDKRARANQISNDAEEQLLRIDSILSSIDRALMAKAALQCKAYARSLMNFEQQVVELQENNLNTIHLHDHYERLHEIYAHLDEPDGMEGISTLILSPSLEHQIRQHESTGRWTSAQSCWEVRLQQSPDNLDFHLGLLRCLRNLGHYDTLRTHVKGVLVRNPNWQTQLVGFQVESEWMLGNWGEVRTLVENTDAKMPPVLLAQILLAMRSGDTAAVAGSLYVARMLLGAPIVASGVKGYRRSYDAVLNLHLVHEVEVIHDAMASLASGQNPSSTRELVEKLSQRLSARLDSTLPTFRTREPILSMRRTAFGLSSPSSRRVKEVIGHAWLASAKIARKAGHWQTAYSAMLQTQQCQLPFSFMQNARLTKASGEPLRALQELESSMRLSGIMADEAVDLTDDTKNMQLKAKAQLLRARWMNDSDHFDANTVFTTYQNAAELWPKWESGQFYVGQFQDECFKALPQADQEARGMKMNLGTVRSYTKAMRYGSKYIYQTVPRLLTLWLDMGEHADMAKSEIFVRINADVQRAIKLVPVYKWFTAFPQIVSRVGHSNNAVFDLLSTLISMIIQEYPRQALWLFTSVVKSTKAQRSARGTLILDKLRALPASDVPSLVNASLSMTNELLALCDYPVKDDKKTLSMSKDFPYLFKLAPSDLVIPLQESLTVSLPPTSSSEIVLPDGTHAAFQPFPLDLPTFARFHDEIDVMRSLAKPRKITVQGSNGQIYMFLGKPKDDLRKDARLMDFNSIVNKLLKSRSESRRRQLHIRTYGVVTLNEECGFIQWVPNTIPVRSVLTKGYDRHNIRAWAPEMGEVFTKIKDKPDKEAARIFVEQILSQFPPLFHEWFVETFPEPTAWLASRLAYSRTAAVMSMVGFIVGLGDRHCENILLDTNTGDVVHVDFNCLFEKGKSLETPERVPFRLTQNIVDGFGITGVEGVFRIAGEVTMEVLRDNKDSLMSVLDAFIHDPLVEWEDEKRRRDRDAKKHATGRTNTVRESADLVDLAKNALKAIDKKLKGIYTTGRERMEKEISTSGLVQVLIREATDNANLGKMYPGWAPWH